jgi:hypothetical protein
MEMVKPFPKVIEFEVKNPAPEISTPIDNPAVPMAKEDLEVVSKTAPLAIETAEEDEIDPLVPSFIVPAFMAVLPL